MKLHDFIHSPSRPAWTARLVVYIAFIVTIVLFVQFVHLWIL